MHFAGEVTSVYGRPNNLAGIRVDREVHALLQRFGEEKRTKGNVIARRKSESCDLVSGVGGLETNLQSMKRKPLRQRMDRRLRIEPAIDLVFKHHDAARNAQYREKQRRGQACVQVKVQDDSAERHWPVF